MSATTPMLRRILETYNIQDKDSLLWHLRNDQNILKELSSVVKKQKIHLEDLYSKEFLTLNSEEVTIYHAIFFGQLSITEARKVSFYNCLFMNCVLIKSDNVEINIDASNLSGLFISSKKCKLGVSRTRLYRLSVDNCRIELEKCNDIQVEKICDNGTIYNSGIQEFKNAKRNGDFYGPKDEVWYFQDWLI